MNDFLVWILVAAMLVIITQTLSSWEYRRKYKQVLIVNSQLNRALRISQNKILDSEQERKWLGKQIELLINTNPNIDMFKQSLEEELL